MNSAPFGLDPELISPSLEASWEEMDLLWPRLLSQILAQVDSPARTADLREDLARADWLLETARTWADLDAQDRQQAWEALAGRLIRTAYATRPHCLRCGRCCSSGSPALLAQEAELVRPDGAFHKKAYTIRAGEPVLDRRAGGVDLVETELIKPLEPGGGCYFFEKGTGCQVYENRPAQCRALACWEEMEGVQEFEGPFLDRGRALEGRPLLLDYAAAHQARCPSRDLVELARQALEDHKPALAALEERIGFDLHTRFFAKEKGHIEEEELDLVLGRPLAVILEPLGLKVWEIQGRIRLRQSS